MSKMTANHREEITEKIIKALKEGHSPLAERMVSRLCASECSNRENLQLCELNNPFDSGK